MQEDVAGMTTLGTDTAYATCSECGAVFRRSAVHMEPAGLRDDSHSEFTELCPDCERLDRQGESPVQVDDR